MDGRVATSLSLLAVVSVTEIERELFLYHRQIKCGMTPEQVEDALGPPLTREELREEICYKYKYVTVTFTKGRAEMPRRTSAGDSI